MLFAGAICATENKTGVAQRQSTKAITGMGNRGQIVKILEAKNPSCI